RRRARQCLERLEISQSDQVCEGRRIEKISHDDGDLMTEESVHGWHSATENRVIDGVVVHECREMNQLERRRERDGLGLRLLGYFARQQKDRRTKQFPAHRQQVRGDLTDERKIAGNDVRHRVRNLVQLVANWKLNRLEAHSTRRGDVHFIAVFGGGRSCCQSARGRFSGSHFEAALVICFSRLLTSRKSMSIANTR